MEKVEAYICLTEFSKQKLVEAGIPCEKIFIRPNYIDASRVVPAPGEGNYVAYLGRLSPEKGIWTLVRAFEETKDIQLRIAGTGPLETDLRSYIRERNLSNIRLVGFVSREEKWDFLKNSLFLVVPSEWYENFPLVILEAYAAGKPVVASNLGSLPYMVEEGKSGLLFEPRCASKLLERVHYLIANPGKSQRMGKYGRELVDSKYNPRTAYESLMAILRGILGT
jgi:glycosyltransferase involved in cell wall biosynthesis